jgi:hypothetical protein
MRKSAAIAAIATAALLGIAGTALAQPLPGPSQSGQISGQVTVGEVLTLEITSGASFTVTGATPGTPYDGIPATDATVLTNDTSGFSVQIWQDDNPSAVLGNPGAPSGCSKDDAFAGGGAVIPDDSWTITSTGGPGAPGTAQAFSEDPAVLAGGSPYTCPTPAPLPVTVGTSNAESPVAGNSYQEQLAVDIPANTPATTFNGLLTLAAIGS